MSYHVYLAGPIRGLSYVSATDWRDYVKGELPPEIIARSPLRGKAYLQGEGCLDQHRYHQHLSTQRGVTARDRYDATHCDVLFVNLLGATEVSIGTMIELGWANAHQALIILCIEPEGNPHEHAIVRELADYRVPTLAEGIDILIKILSHC
jgi:nucleoside 2-deoxyribosyltransferase